MPKSTAVIPPVLCALILLRGFSEAAPAQGPAFEVASVKPNHSDSQRSRYPMLRNGRFDAENITLKTLVSIAYGLSALRIEGPNWLNLDKFDISASAPEGAAGNELAPLLQSLLASRFQLAVHRETKELPTFEMVVLKSGLKMKLFDPANPPKPLRNRGGSALVGAGTMPVVADMLARVAERPVIDKTGLEGRFYVEISYSLNPDQATGELPDFFSAVQQELGLKLDPKKQPIEILVIDHAERVPTEN